MILLYGKELSLSVCLGMPVHRIRVLSPFLPWIDKDKRGRGGGEKLARWWSSVLVCTREASMHELFEIR